MLRMVSVSPVDGVGKGTPVRTKSAQAVTMVPMSKLTDQGRNGCCSAPTPRRGQAWP